jgi:hypothetical protein
MTAGTPARPGLQQERLRGDRSHIAVEIGQQGGAVGGLGGGEGPVAEALVCGQATRGQAGTLMQPTDIRSWISTQTQTQTNRSSAGSTGDGMCGHGLRQSLVFRTGRLMIKSARSGSRPSSTGPP